MAVTLPSVYQDGTASITTNTTAVVGQSTLWTKSLLPGDFFGVHKGYSIRILSIEDDTHMTLANPYPGATQTTAHYEVALQSDNARMQETSRQFLQKMQSGNLDALAGLTGLPDTFPMFTGPGAMSIVTKADLTNGLDFDVQVDTLADRAAYNSQGTGFSVLVSDNGDGRSALYSKASAASGDWSDPAFITGPVGPMPTLAPGTVTSLAPGATPTIGINPVTGGYTIDFGIPKGRGWTFQGAWSSATAYVLDDVVSNNGSTWIALVANTNHAPPVLPTTSNTWWSLVAAAGGGGDMLKSVYDPTSINASAFARANHTGTQALSTITGFNTYAAKSATYTAVLADNSANLRFTAAATLALTTSATLGAGWGITVTADGGDVTIDPASTQTINGQATFIVRNGTSARIICDGTNFFVIQNTGIWETLGAFTLSAASQLVITGLDNAKFLRLTGIIDTMSAAGLLTMQVSTNGGSTYDTGTNYYSQAWSASNATLAAGSLPTAASFPLSGQGSSDVSTPVPFEAILSNFNKAARLNGFVRSFISATGAGYAQNMANFHLTATARNAMKIFNSGSGTMSGVIVVEQIRG